MKTNRVNLALKDLEKASELVPVLKGYAKKDKDFSSLLDDHRFKKIVGDKDDNIKEWRRY